MASLPLARQHPGCARSPSAPRYAKHLLASLPATPFRVRPETPEPALHDALAWAQCGAMDLTGEAAGPPKLAPAAFATACEGAALALEALGGPRIEDPAGLLGERAALLGLSRRGAISPGGQCRILPARDGWVAVQLARREDIQLLPAWLEAPCPNDPWPTLRQHLRQRDRDFWVARARLMGLPVAPVLPPRPSPPHWIRVHKTGSPGPTRPADKPRVLDLSSLWAGPLCTQLLAGAGARVVKVESAKRPDGARRGPPAFFDLMNAGKQSVALDFTQREDRLALARLLEAADIVVESARPRALAQLGFDAAAWLQAKRGRTWLSVTGYGREEPRNHWVAFGDDAAVAAGAALAVSPASPIFVGDAIADPLTGLHAAVAAQAAFLSGGGLLLDVALCDVVGHILGALPASPARVQPAPEAAGGFSVVAGDRCASVQRPRARPAHGTAPALGADTANVLESTSTC